MVRPVLMECGRVWANSGTTDLQCGGRKRFERGAPLHLFSSSHAAPEQGSVSHWIGPRDWARDCAVVCERRRFRFSHRAHGRELAAAAAEINKGVSASQGNTSEPAGYLALDLTEEKACQRVFAAARQRFGRVDILVNTAGQYGPVVPVEEYPVADFDKVIAVHLRAAFLLSKLALPEMYSRQSGVILNISSLSAKSAFAWGSAYAAAKAGMLGLTRVTAAEAARKGVRINALSWACDRDCYVTGTRRDARKETGGQPAGTVARLLEHAAARPGTNRRRNRPSGAFLVFGGVQRDYRAGDQNGRWRRLFLIFFCAPQAPPGISGTADCKRLARSRAQKCRFQRNCCATKKRSACGAPLVLTSIRQFLRTQR
jgi:NAD(P)-dependent dehydrogenase (short-subunit alcohol dehydrogenase family)